MHQVAAITSHSPFHFRKSIHLEAGETPTKLQKVFLQFGLIRAIDIHGDVTTVVQEYLSKVGCALQSVSLSSTSLTSLSLSKKSFSHLSSLALVGIEISGENVKEIATFGTRLSFFQMKRCQIEEGHLVQLIQSFGRRLRKLEFSDMDVSITILRAIAGSSFARKLQFLNLNRINPYYCTQLMATAPDPYSIVDFPEYESCRDVVRQMIALYGQVDPLLTEEAPDLFNSLSGLVELHLEGRKEVSIDFINSLALKNLQLLSIVGTPPLKDLQSLSFEVRQEYV